MYHINNKEPNNEPAKRQKYFDEALSDFVHDMASGRAVRHLADTGYTTTQIMQMLDYPASRQSVEKTVYRHFIETGIILTKLPVPKDSMVQSVLECSSEAQLYACLKKHLAQNGEEHSYISCPFGLPGTNTADALQKLLSPLTTREKEYILGIPWEPAVMYHRLNRRMLEIGLQLAAHSCQFSFYFIKSLKTIIVKGQ